MSGFQNSDLEKIYTALGAGALNPDLFSIDNQIDFLTDADCPELVPYLIDDAVFLSITNTGATKIIMSGINSNEIEAGDNSTYTFPNAGNMKHLQYAIIVPAGGTCTVLYQKKIAV